MRVFLILLFILPFFAGAQKLVLLDRNLLQPAIVIDSISINEATKGAIAIYAKDVHAILSSVQRLVRYVDDEKKDEKKVFDLEMGNSKWIVKTEKIGPINNYNIVLNTNTGNFRTAFLLVSHEPGKIAAQRLTMFMDYLRNNISIMPAL
jgi:hypothetical protein